MVNHLPSFLIWILQHQHKQSASDRTPSFPTGSRCSTAPTRNTHKTSFSRPPLLPFHLSKFLSLYKEASDSLGRCFSKRSMESIDDGTSSSSRGVSEAEFQDEKPAQGHKSKDACTKLDISWEYCKSPTSLQNIDSDIVMSYETCS